MRVWEIQDNGLPRDGESGRDVYETSSERQALWSAVFAPKGDRILTIGGTGARLWDRDSGLPLNVFTPHGHVASASFSPDGKLIVTGGWDNTARIWNTSQRKTERKLIGHTGFVNSAQFSPDGTQTLTASDDRTARLWDVRSGKVVTTFRGHSDRVRTAIFSPDGTRILTASNDKTAVMWNAANGQQQFKLIGHEWPVLAVAISRNGKIIATGSEDHTTRLWNAKTGKPIQFRMAQGNLPGRLAGHTDSVTAVSVSPDGRRLVTGSADRSAKIWELRSGREILTLREHQGPLTSVEFSPDGRSILTSSRDETAIIWFTQPWDEQVAVRSEKNMDF